MQGQIHENSERNPAVTGLDSLANVAPHARRVHASIVVGLWQAGRVPARECGHQSSCCSVS
jgi:hypothetical protein